MYKYIFRYTFHNTRGNSSLIDYISTNRNIYHSHLPNIRGLNASTRPGTQHNLVLWKKVIMQVTIITKKGPTEYK